MTGTMTPRRFHVGPHDAGKDLDSWLKSHLGLPWRDLRELVRGGRVFLDGKPCVDPSRRLRRGQSVEVRIARTRRGPKEKPRRAKSAKTPSLPQSALCHVDDHIVVVDKPPGLTTMRHAEDVAQFGKRARRFLPSTLADLL